MTRSLWIPDAVHDGPWWFGDTISVTPMDQITKLVLHSTETSGSAGCPGYAGGTMAPTVTVDPWSRRAWQHFVANGSAKALADPGSTAVRENRDDVAQIEIIGYCDPALSARYGYAISDIPDSGLEYLANVLRFYHDEWGLPLVTTLPWKPYAELASGRTSVRLSGPAYDAYTGVLGHQHVSGNAHLDPGDLDVTRILDLALHGAGASNPIPEQEHGFLMSLSDADQLRLLKNTDSILARVSVDNGDDSSLMGRLMSAQGAAQDGRERATQATNASVAAAGKVDGLTLAFSKLTEAITAATAAGHPVDIDMAALEAAAERGAQAGVADAIKAIDVTVTTSSTTSGQAGA